MSSSYAIANNSKGVLILFLEERSWDGEADDLAFLMQMRRMKGTD